MKGVEVDTPENQYNLVNFDNIVSALLTVYHYVYNTNFTLIRAKYTHYINPYISSFYFITLSLSFFYIFANLIMISMSKAYMEQITHKLAKPAQQEADDRQE